MSKSIKYILFVGGIIIALLLIIPCFINLDGYKDSIISQVKEQTGRNLVIGGKIGLSILPTPRVKLSKVQLSSLAGAQDTNLLEVDEVKVKVALLPLVVGKISISQILLKNPVINLEKLKNGQKTWELQGTGGHKQDAVAADSVSSSKNSSPLASLPFMIHQITLQEGKIKYIDQGKVFETDNINLDIDIAGVNGPINLALDLNLLGNDLKLKGKVKEIEADRLPLHLTLAAFGEQIDIEGELALDSGSFVGALQGKGDLKDLVGDSLPQGLRTEHKITANIKADKEKVILDQIAFSMDSITASGKALYSLGDMPTNMELKFSPGDVIFSFTPISDQSGVGGAMKLSATDFDSFLKALKADTGSLPHDITSNLSLNSNISYSDENLALQNMALNLGKIQIKGRAGAKNWSSKLSFPYDIAISDASSLSLLLGYKLPISLKGVNIRGETSLDKNAIITNTHINAAKAEIVLKGAIDSKSSITVSASGSSLNQTLQELFQTSGGISLGAFNVSAELEGDLGSKKSIGITVGEGGKSSIVVGSKPIYLKGKINLDLAKNKPDFVVDLTLSEINLNRGRGVGTAQAPSGNQSVSGSHWSRDNIDLSGLNEVSGSISIHIAKLIDGGLIFDNIALQSKLSDGVLKADSITAGLYGGKLSAEGSLSGKGNQPIKLSVSLKDAMLKNVSPEGKRIKVTEGVVSFNCNLESFGSSQYDYVSNLSGGINLTGRNGKVSGMNLHQIASSLNKLRDINSLGQNLDSGFNGGETKFSNMVGTAVVSKGVMDITKCELASDDISISSMGKVNLPQFSLDVHSTINTGVKNMPPFAVHFYGPIDHPQHKLDMQALRKYLVDHVLKGVLDNLKGGKTNPKDILKGVFGGGGEKDEGGDAPKEKGEDSSDNPVNNLLKEGVKGLFK